MARDPPPVGAPHQRWLVGVAALLALLLVAAASLSTRRHAAGPVSPRLPLTIADLDAMPLPVRPIRSDQEAGELVGSGTCAGCHPRHWASHAASGHARAARLASLATDAAHFRRRAALRDGTLGLEYAPLIAGDRLLVQCTGYGLRMNAAVDLAIGSGTHGVTYVAVHKDGSSLVPRISLYRTGKGLRWGWTPGIGPATSADEPTGQRLPAAGTAACVGCHSTTAPPVFSPEEARLGIGCERCHGPARKHLGAVGRGPEKETAGRGARRAPGRTGALQGSGEAPVTAEMVRLSSLSGPQVLALCNSCHRPLGRVKPDGLPDDLARAQPLALMMSRCFRESGGRLSCVSCHNPHERPVHQAAHYERVCVGCHSSTRSRITLCPVDQTSGCVSCHMSRERMRQFNDTVFANHWIRRRPVAGNRTSPPAGGSGAVGQ